MTNERSLLNRILPANPSRAAREEKVLRYVIHRINEDADLREVLQEPYVRRNCSGVEIDEITSSADLVHACREHLEQTFRSGELDPGHRSRVGRA